jgi:transcriptional regulator with GAF, ATPase, and Fis domain
VLKDVHQVSATNTTVLIVGETGTGKELIARAVHEGSPRKDKPLITVNCAAIPSTLMESEFFGHEAGAFTGATRKREGRFELAEGGTIFLDEIGEMTPDLQSKLLRVLHDGEFQPVGSSRTKRANVRVIAATNRNLQEMIREGKFREDLYYRIHVFPVSIPPLRDRGDDVVLLAKRFAEQFAQKIGKKVLPLTSDCHRTGCDYIYRRQIESGSCAAGSLARFQYCCHTTGSGSAPQNSERARRSGEGKYFACAGNRGLENRRQRWRRTPSRLETFYSHIAREGAWDPETQT